MKNLHFVYEMQIEYSVEVARCNFTIKCIPQNTRRQQVTSREPELFPETPYLWGTDGLCNTQIYGVNESPHRLFRFRIEGDATTGLSDYEEDENEDLSMVFAHPHGLNVPGEKIREYYCSLKLPEELPPLERAVELMHRLHEDFSYRPCVTDVDTSAEEAFVLGRGVCQDYAHMFIALLHLAGIPARYVTGLILGEGASHAWVEILMDGKWYGLDPTNDVRVTDDHIKIGVGRDSKDCLINRGIMHGGGCHTMKIFASVTEC